MSDDYGLEAFFRLIDTFARKDIIDTAAKIAPNHEALAELAYNLRRAKDVLVDAAQYVEDELVKAMPNKVVTIDGIGEVEYHTGAKRTQWDKEALIAIASHAVAGAVPVLIDAETGEVQDPYMLTDTIITEWCAIATPSWKVTGLRLHGIDPDQFCETTWGRKTIDMPKPDKFIPMPNVEEAMQ